MLSSKMTYPNFLNTVKENINPCEIGVDIGDIRQTKDRNFMLTIQNGSDRGEVVIKEIAEKLPEATVSTRAKRKEIQFKGTDELRTEEEIKEAIVRTTSTKEKTIDTNALYPANGDKPNVTVILVQNKADQIRNRNDWVKDPKFNTATIELYKSIAIERLGHDHGYTFITTTNYIKEGTLQHHTL